MSSTATQSDSPARPTVSSASTLLNSMLNASLNSPWPEPLKRAFFNSLLTARLNPSPVSALQELQELAAAITAALAAASSPPSETGHKSPYPKDSPNPMPAPEVAVPAGDPGAGGNQ
jgi:hypothetical protein